MNAEAKKRYKEIEFPFTCPVTNRIFDSNQGLSCYVTKTLKMTHSDYYDNHINHRDKSCFFCGGKGLFISISRGYRNLCENTECVKKSFKSHSVEGFMYRNNCSREEAEKLFEIENQRQLKERLKTQSELRNIDPLWDKKRSHNCKEFWIKKGYSEEESIRKSKEVMNDIHQKTFQKFKDNPEKYVNKYDTKIEYYLNKGYSEDESKELLSKRQKTFSLEKCIEKYGEIDGMNLWKDRQIKWLNTMNSKSDEEKLDIIKRRSSYCKKNYSKVSQKLFWEIYNKVEDKRYYYFKELNTEFVLVGKKTFIYDFLNNESKKIIEFNGDYWHCNPLKYNENYYHNHLKMYAKERWENDNNRIKLTEEMGYKILIIWESEYRKNKELTLQKCLDFLRN